MSAVPKSGEGQGAAESSGTEAANRVQTPQKEAADKTKKISISLKGSSKSTRTSQSIKADPADMQTKIVAELEKLSGSIPERRTELTQQIDFLKSKHAHDLPKPRLLAPDQKMTLWRGCSPEQLAAYIFFKATGGMDPKADLIKPTKEEAQAQVAELQGLPEFTLDTNVGERFGTDNVVVAVKISAALLTEGSETEKGYVCHMGLSL